MAKISDFYKCGEITTSIQAGKKIFAFNCTFCTTVHLQLEEFTSHIEENHYNELYEYDDIIEENNSNYTDLCGSNNIKEEFDVEKSSHGLLGAGNSKLPGHQLNTQNLETMILFDDPLEEKPISMDSEELPLCTINDLVTANEEHGTDNNIYNILEENASDANSDRSERESDFKIEPKVKKTETRVKFRNELQKQKLTEAQRGIYTNPSIYHPSLTQKPHNNITKSALPLPKLTDAQNVKIIEIYKSYPCLWDSQQVGFRSKKQRNIAIEEMMVSIRNQMHLDLTQDELLDKLDRIRYACTQDKQRKLECGRMQTEFRPSNKYFEQISFLADHVGPFKCDICGKTLNSPDQYRTHKSNHDGSVPFHCPICNRGFMQTGNYNVHVRRHTRDYPFECEVCGKRFGTTTDIKRHMRHHTGEKPYVCEICGQSFHNWSILDAHKRRHEKRHSHYCTICDKAFYNNNELTDHIKVHLNIRDKVCNICGKAFTRSKNLRQHKQIHAEKKKYVCKICKKAFAQSAGLSGHMKSHGTNISGGLSRRSALNFVGDIAKTLEVG